MQIITNNKRPTHLTVINGLLNNAEEVIICVAFLKNSGLNSIIKKISDNCTFYIGTDYFLSEPDAIRNLINKGYRVYITKKKQSTFHPKIYYFKKGKSISILTGSANLTGGGLNTNFEASILLQTEENSSVDKAFKLMIKNYSLNST